MALTVHSGQTMHLPCSGKRGGVFGGNTMLDYEDHRENSCHRIYEGNFGGGGAIGEKIIWRIVGLNFQNEVQVIISDSWQDYKGNITVIYNQTHQSLNR